MGHGALFSKIALKLPAAPLKRDPPEADKSPLRSDKLAGNLQM